MRLDFIFLDEFIRKNPWLTEEELTEIVALNDPARDSISSYDRTTAMTRTDQAYAANAVRLFRSRKDKNEFAAELGISSEDQQKLDWLIRRLRWQVLTQDTTRQNYAE